MIYPWLTNYWQQLMAYKQDKRLPHALLFSGIEGIGKKGLAETFAQAILCKGSDNEACKVCQSCLLLQANSHPDYVIVSPEKLGGLIKIDQIREVVKFVQETSQQGGYKVVIINPANAMNVYAANAILKTLEEPSPKSLFILITDQTGRLLPTIKSRCQQIVFSKPDTDLALNWLATSTHHSDLDLVLNIANGAPLRAKSFIENDTLAIRKELYTAITNLQFDPIALALTYHNTDLNLIFNLLLSLLQDYLRFHLSAGRAEVINSDFKKFLLEWKVQTDAVLTMITDIQKAQNLACGPYNLNKQLLLEELFVNWSQRLNSTESKLC